MAAIPSFPESQLMMICDILGDVESGLSESEVGAFLSASNIKELSRGDSRRKRLFDALWAQQCQDNCANNVVAFIHKAMYHVLHTGQMQLFEQRRTELNGVLAFSGLMLGAEGRVIELSAEAPSISPAAQQRAKELRGKLTSLNAHADVVAVCNAELLADNNYFAVVYEAARRIGEKIRAKTRLTVPSNELVQKSFGIGERGYPMLALNRLQTEAERAEQAGFLELLKGVMSMFGDIFVKPRAPWPVSEQEAIEFLSFFSLVQRRLDKAVVTVQVS